MVKELPRQNLKIALIADELSRSCLALECSIRDITSLNYYILFKLWKPDLFFVESAWHGHRNSWKYSIAAYPEHKSRSNRKLRQVVECARNMGIPTVFWNKEDGVHFDRFIDSACMFDFVFTVDSNCIDNYRIKLGPNITVNTLTFPVQPLTHSFSGFDFKQYRANFVGSYSHHIHDIRRQWQDMAFVESTKSGLGLTVFDRNSNRTAPQYRYPNLPNLNVLPSVRHDMTGQIYKDYLVSLNVNTVNDSPSMYSRRLVEILACGGIAVTSPAKSVDLMFADYCHVVSSPEQARELFDRLKHGPSVLDLERARSGADYVLKQHTWSHRLQEIVFALGL